MGLTKKNSNCGKINFFFKARLSARVYARVSLKLVRCLLTQWRKECWKSGYVCYCYSLYLPTYIYKVLLFPTCPNIFFSSLFQKFIVAYLYSSYYLGLISWSRLFSYCIHIRITSVLTLIPCFCVSLLNFVSFSPVIGHWVHISKISFQCFVLKPWFLGYC